MSATLAAPSSARRKRKPSTGGGGSEVPATTFADVAGMDAAKAELAEVGGRVGAGVVQSWEVGGAAAAEISDGGVQACVAVLPGNMPRLQRPPS